MLILLHYIIYRVLGNRVSELEKKLKTLEISGLWSHGKLITYFQNRYGKADFMFPQKLFSGKIYCSKIWLSEYDNAPKALPLKNIYHYKSNSDMRHVFKGNLSFALVLTASIVMKNLETQTLWDCAKAEF